jgi:hypothetical protein
MSEEVWKQEHVHVFLLYNVRRSVARSKYMYSSCIMSEEVWKQEHVHVFLLYNVRRSVETGVCTCIPPV